MTISKRRIAMVAAGCTIVTGCTAFSYYPYDCADYAACDEPPSCPGQCVPLPPLEFNGPALVWIGNKRDAPECPIRAPTMVYEGFADLDASNECPACECSPPACAFPSGLTANGQTCQNGGGMQTSFDAPLGWNGSCVSPGTVPSADLASITIEPATADPCKPIVPETPTHFEFGSSWGTYARACAGEAVDGVCGDAGMTCLPTAGPPPPGFRQCILYLRDGDPTCPEEYPDEFQFYGGLDDTRECTPCECTETASSDCIALVSLYESASCSGSAFASLMIDMVPNACTANVPVSVASLRSMSASWITNDPGTCAASGGLPVGSATPRDPTTFCCQPPP